MPMPTQGIVEATVARRSGALWTRPPRDRDRRGDQRDGDHDPGRPAEQPGRAGPGDRGQLRDAGAGRASGRS
ncbi:hypothetical protein [Amycolatopsis sp. NPDC004625]|uniref:hypothetical protein n=1 Tax=Amycolatopsis sp. NPDC004625 TaxID=3154670 RepID=UPI0033BBA2E1